MELRPAISRLKASFSPAYYSLKGQAVFKQFVIHLVRALSIDEREAFRHWCIGIIPESKLDVNVARDGVMFRLMEFLCNDCKLSFTDLKKFLSSVNRYDLFEALERVEVLNYMGCIVEDYVNSSLRQGNCKKFADSFENIVGFMHMIRQGNQELISPLLEQFMEANENGKALEILDSVILDSQLSWASEFLTGWIRKNGGLKALEELIKKNHEVASSGSAVSSIGESLKNNFKLLGNRVDTELINR
ncbi:hypothetical protein ACROYT_G002229 [Oculina patagonica]